MTYRRSVVSMCLFCTVSEICGENFTQSFIYTRQLGAYQQETTHTYTKLLTLLAFFVPNQQFMPLLKVLSSEFCNANWSRKTRTTDLSGGEKVWRYVQPFRHNTSVWQPDRQTRHWLRTDEIPTSISWCAI